MDDSILSSRPSHGYKLLIKERRNSLEGQLSCIFRDGDRFVFEVGSGHGHFLTAYAQRHPDEVCVGIDIIGERVERATRKRDRANLRRLHFLHAEAGLFLETVPPAVLITRVFVLFPDPWPKSRHHKHRVIQPGFLSLLRSRVCSNAELFFRTDYRPYFEHALATVTSHPDWRVSDTAWPFEHESVFQQRAEIHYSFSAGLRH